MFKNKKTAAMFGLDARIALAIFGALSVITGAALFSAIKEAKLVSIITEVSEVEKAVGAYMLDVGSMLPLSSNYPVGDLSIKALITKPTGATGWNGPYISYEGHATLDRLLLPSGKNMVISYRNTDWSTSGTCKKASKNCILFVTIEQTAEKNKSLEKKLEGTASPADTDSTGTFRYDNSANHWGYFMTDIPFDPATSSNT